jgi:hypothetical protein
MTDYTFDENIVSDLHKDAYGFRPSVAWMHAWETSTDEEKQGIWDSLIEEMKESMDRERRMAEQAVADFESDLATIMFLGAGDRATALRWMTQDEEFYNDQCVEHWVWKHDILFTDYGTALCKELKGIVTFKEYE